MPGGSSPSDAYTAWTGTRWPWTWPSCRFGWQRWQRTTRSRSWTTACGPAILWLGYRGNKLLRSTGRPQRRGKRQNGFSFGDPIAESIQRATEFRQRILAARDEVPYEHLRQQLDVADEALDKARFVGDLAVSAYFSAEKDKAREVHLRELALRLVKYLGPGGKMEDRQPLADSVRQLRSGDRPVPPFHWEIEFPEVFGDDNLGFDAIVGNPPFAGRTTLSEGSRPGYIDWLKTIHEESHGNADLVAHFFRRAFDLLRRDGCFGLIATNTIGQGDTRSTGLRWLCTHGGTVFAARKRLRWPGQAAVVVSVVHVCRGTTPSPFILDSRPVPVITAYLFHSGGHDDPARLLSNKGKSFQGCVVVGLGFTFDDTDSTGAANQIAVMHELIATNPRNADRIFPYLGGEEVNDSATHAHHRYVINFGDMPEEECRRRWPDLMRIVEDKVRPDRIEKAKGGGLDRKKRAEVWWQFSRTAKDLYQTIRGLDRVLVCAIIANKLSFVFLPTNMVFSHKLMVFALSDYAAFSIVQSRFHEVWARMFTSTMKDDLNYSNTDCFETFPFPQRYDHNASLEEGGRAYYDFRASVMVRNNEGLTKTYNRFHDPAETSPDILKLRELHAAMDRAVLDAYGWTDLKPTCEFLLDYEEEEEDENGGASKKRKPWRCRWPDDFRDEVLARLLDLNKKRAEEERLSGHAAEGAAKKPGKARGRAGSEHRPLLE